MKISELIAALEAIKAEHGDLPVALREMHAGDSWYRHDSVDAALLANTVQRADWVGGQWEPDGGIKGSGPLIVELL